MTSEVCLMNRHAAVLAADSATTVSAWTGDGRETRYFKGANKIHQLSDDRPVGLMIFDSADILNVPWEVAVKAFRAAYGHGSSPTLEGYAKEFFAFLEGNKQLFPDDIQREELLRAGKLAAWSIARPIMLDTSIDQADWTAAFDAADLTP